MSTIGTLRDDEWNITILCAAKHMYIVFQLLQDLMPMKNEDVILTPKVNRDDGLGNITILISHSLHEPQWEWLKDVVKTGIISNIYLSDENGLPLDEYDTGDKKS